VNSGGMEYLKIWF